MRFKCGAPSTAGDRQTNPKNEMRICLFIVNPVADSSEVVILNIQVSTKLTKADLGRWRPPEAAVIISMHQILNIGMIYVVL